MKKSNRVAATLVFGAAASLGISNAQAGSTKNCDSVLTCQSLKAECSAGNGVYGGYTQGQTHWGICWFPISVKLG